MPKHTKHGSKAFRQGQEYSFQLQKKTAETRRSGGTQEHRLLSRQDARNLRKSRMKIFTKKAFQAVEENDFGTTALNRFEQQTVGAILGMNIHRAKIFSTLASNPLGRSAYFDAMFDALAQIHADPDVAMYFVTIVDDGWCLAEEAISFDTYSMMRRGKRALRDIGYHGLLILEIQVLVGLKGTRFMPHLHGFIWPRSKDDMGPRKAAQHLNKRFEGVNKATGVTISLMPQHLPKSLVTRFHYVSKLPNEANSYCPVKGDPHALTTPIESLGRMKKAADRNYTNEDALRICAMLGQYQADEIVFAVGEGTKVRKAASKALTAAVNRIKRARPDPKPKAVLGVIEKLLSE